jgi:hypothetical protein
LRSRRIRFYLVCDELALWGRNRQKDSEISTLKSENSRLRVALNTEPATPSALLQLTNRELKAKSSSVVTRLREINSINRDRTAEIRAQATVDEQTKRGQIDAVLRELDQQFMDGLRSDAFNVDFELRRRLGPKAVAGIVGITPSIVANDGTRINFQQLVPAGMMPIFDLAFIPILASGIEQMAKLLPMEG